MTDERSLTTQKSFLLYTAPDGEVRLEVFLQDETLWLTQKMMAEFFEPEYAGKLSPAKEVLPLQLKAWLKDKPQKAPSAAPRLRI